MKNIQITIDRIIFFVCTIHKLIFEKNNTLKTSFNVKKKKNHMLIVDVSLNTYFT